MKKAVIAFLMMLGLVAAGCGTDTTTVNYTNSIDLTVQYVAKQIIVKTDKKRSAWTIAEINKRYKDKGLLSITPFKTDPSTLTLTFSNNIDPYQISIEIKELSTIKIAEPNYLMHVLESGVPNDPKLGELWGLKNTGQTDASGQAGISGADINATSVWSMGHTGSKDVTVAIIDTGVDWDHPDLKENIWTNPGEAGELAENGKDDDGNGFIDDTHGWNFASNNRDSNDDHNHGTHCAGTIGGVGNNGQGVVGVNWNVSIMPLKFLTASGSGTLQDAVEAINYARMMGVDIMSNSWGGGPKSEVLKSAIEEASKAGILFIAAAGNSSGNNDQMPAYPASYKLPNVISVAATDNRDKIAPFSCYGETSVHVAAPGVKIVSTVKDGKYATYSGTSMATPHVAGMAAMLKSIYPDMDFAQIKDRLIKTSDPIRALSKKSVSKGRVDLYNAVMNIVPGPIGPNPNKWKVVQKDLESKHPYDNKTTKEFNLEFPNAKYIMLHFKKVEIENRYDTLSVIEPETGLVLEVLSGDHSDYWTQFIVGDKVKLILKADVNVNKWGFKLDKVKLIH